MDATYPTSTITHPPPPLPPETPTLDEDDEYGLPKPTDWLSKLVSLQADLIYNCCSTFSASLLSLLSAASESYPQVEEAKDTVETSVHQAPSTLVNPWVEEPVFVGERFHFDYTEPHPTAVFTFGSANDIYQAEFIL